MYKPGEFVKTIRGLYYIVNVYGQQYDVIIVDKYVGGERLGVISKVPVWYKTKHKVLEITQNMYQKAMEEIFQSDVKELKKVASGK